MTRRAGTPKALARAAQAEKNARRGSAIIFFKEPQNKVPFWRGVRDDDCMRVFHNARIELRSTPTVTFICVIQNSSSGPVEFVYDFADVSRYSTFPVIEVAEGDGE